MIAGAAVLVIGGGAAVMRGRLRRVNADSTTADTMRSYEVKTGTISTTVSGTGTLTADDVETLDLSSLVEVDSVYVKAGDTVQEGDLLASVDTVSVKTALKLLQEEIDDLDEEIEDEQGETVSSSIKSGVAGRVKKIYASVDDEVSVTLPDGTEKEGTVESIQAHSDSGWQGKGGGVDGLSVGKNGMEIHCLQ